MAIGTVCVIVVSSSVLAIEGLERGGKRVLLLVNLLLIASKEVSWLVVTLFAAGTAFLVLLLYYFLEEERYRRPSKPEKGVEFVAARRAVEARISALAPGVLLLAEKERFVADRLKEGALGEEARRRVEGLLRDAALTGFWEKFVEVSILADSDPVRAYKELRGLSRVANTALENLGRAEEVVRGEEDAEL